MRYRHARKPTATVERTRTEARQAIGNRNACQAAAAAEYGIPPETFTTHDFHIHVPDGATPKDGPSAGITLSTALISLLTGTPVENKVSMTGEITLRGTVTAIGGVKEKSIGALCAGVEHVILPEENRKDAEEIPAEVKEKIQFHFVAKAEDAWRIAVPGLKKKEPPPKGNKI